MNQQLVSSFTTAALLISTLGIMPSSGQANELMVEDEGVEAGVPDETTSDQDLASTLQAVEASDSSESEEVVKVGEYQSHTDPEENPIAVIHAHVMDGRNAATLYVGGIPVLTFLGEDSISSPTSPESITPLETPSSGVSAETNQASDQPQDIKEFKLASQGTSIQPESPSVSSSSNASDLATAPTVAAPSQAPSEQTVAEPSSTVDGSDPVQRATAIATQINQLHWQGVDAGEISAEWNAEAEQYVISVGDDVLVEFDADTMLPDTTENPAQDVLQATNRIRRQLGEVEPLRAIEGAPSSSRPQIAVGPIQFAFSGVASWYGPGFNGRRSASGEIFNQNALTAAHRTLPFGTLVRVTNMNNGTSVTVRINDRGPFGGGRVIDLSAAAARAIGMIQSGVAPVRVEVLGSANTVSR